MRDNINDLQAFIAVARANSFTRAAARLGVSQSSLSRTLRGLEERLGVRLLIRTTRSVSPTEAGERLLQKVGPRFDEIADELDALVDLRDKPAGLVRITCGELPAKSVVWPKLAKVLPDYPDIKLEIFIDNGFTDIAAERFDAGVRLGESLEKDMIAIKISPDGRMVPVASPDYFREHEPPQTPADLTDHRCINMRLATHGDLYAWEFEKGEKSLRVKVDGPLVFNSIEPMIDAALRGFGIAYLPEREVQHHLESGELVSALDDWCQPFPGLHLYYPSRRQQSLAFEIIANALRHRG